MTSGVMKRRVAVFTGTRAEYGLLVPVMRELETTGQADLRLLVGGTHLAAAHAMTVTEIEADGFPIAERLEFLLASDTAVGVSKSMGLAMIAAGEALDRQRPELLVLLGDRVEALTVGLAALVARIPIAHVHGGETTQGAIDDAARHALTKLSHLHFTSTESYRARVIQLGEDPNRVFHTGAPGLDTITNFDPISSTELSAELGVDLRQPFVVATYHPVTLSVDAGRTGLASLLAALEQHPDLRVVFTAPNADTGGQTLWGDVERFQQARPDRVSLVISAGRHRYLSLLSHAAAVLGNSSSALIEAPSFGLPALDVGPRQQGRVRGPNVVHVETDPSAVAAGLRRVLDPDFRTSIATAPNPYAGSGAAAIARVLVEHPLEGILDKRFHDAAQLAGRGH